MIWRICALTFASVNALFPSVHELGVTYFATLLEPRTATRAAAHDAVSLAAFYRGTYRARCRLSHDVNYDTQNEGV